MHYDPHNPFYDKDDEYDYISFRDATLEDLQKLEIKSDLRGNQKCKTSNTVASAQEL